MKTLHCIPCGRIQPSGKFCLDCGKPLTEKVTLGVNFKPIRTKRTSEQLKRDIRNWLTRIGVQNQDIRIVTSERDKTASVEYVLLGKKYSFTSYKQENTTTNLAGIEQFLHYRVLSVEHGIEDLEKTFAGYTALPPPEEHAWELMTSDDLRQELKKYHPDTGENGGNREKFQKILDIIKGRGAQ